VNPGLTASQAGVGGQGPAAGELSVRIRRLDPGLPLPGYAHPGDAGADLYVTTDVTIEPGHRVTVGTGVALELPPGFAGFVHPRSGLAARAGLTVVNAPGTVDSGYRGEIRVTLLNTDLVAPIELRRGDRVAQLVVQPVVTAHFVEVLELAPAARGEGGFGSTGGFALGSEEHAAAGTDPVGGTRSGQAEGGLR
jgi:dUTP pyrophosphatase